MLKVLQTIKTTKIKPTKKTSQRQLSKTKLKKRDLKNRNNIMKKTLKSTMGKFNKMINYNHKTSFLANKNPWILKINGKRWEILSHKWKRKWSMVVMVWMT
jgi:hypothetical protein